MARADALSKNEPEGFLYSEPLFGWPRFIYVLRIPDFDLTTPVLKIYFRLLSYRW